MKLGIITDIHNNYIALKCVMEKLQQLECDRIICCGDILGVGPYPEETVQYLMQIPHLTVVQGNHERYLFDGMTGKYAVEKNMSQEEKDCHKWEHSLLSQKSVDFLRTLPSLVNMECEGYKVSVMHYHMDSEGEYTKSIYDPTVADLDRMFSDVDSDIVIFGHDHGRTACKGKKLYINAGALGCPSKDKNIARASVLTLENGKAEVEAVDIVYNVSEVIEKIDEINYPYADYLKEHFYGI